MSRSTTDELEAHIVRLAKIPRASASAGEREAADIVAEQLRALGARVRIEPERAHGTYWWPIGLLTGLAAVAGLRRGRLTTIAAACAAVFAADDVTLGRVRLRRYLPQHTTYNVVAEIGPDNAERTVLVHAHHDAAHSGLVFHPELTRWWGRRFPRLLERSNSTPPSMWGAVVGPAMVAIGSVTGLRGLRLLGATICAGYAGAMVDIGLREAVPGANDNLTGVAVLLSLARSLRDQPEPGLRVILLSTGSEESFMEGMRAFGRRHFDALPRESTHVICVDAVGSPHLTLLEAEGTLRMHFFSKDFCKTIEGRAAELGIGLKTKFRYRNLSDGFVPLKAGYTTAYLTSVDDFKVPANYHWPTDVPANVDYGTVYEAASLCDAVVRDLAPSSSQQN